MTSDLDVSTCLHELEMNAILTTVASANSNSKNKYLSTSNGTCGDDTSAMAWLSTVSNDRSLDVTDGARLVGRCGRSPQAEVGLHCLVRLQNNGRRIEATYQSVNNECLTLGAGTFGG